VVVRPRRATPVKSSNRKGSTWILSLDDGRLVAATTSPARCDEQGVTVPAPTRRVDAAGVLARGVFVGEI
jgi:hypothetical protein